MSDPQLFNGSAAVSSGSRDAGDDAAVGALAQLDVAIARFGQWFSGAHEAGGIDMSSPGLMQVLPSLADSFCVGLWGFRFYIAVPPDAADWMAELPITHVLADIEKSTLSIGCAQVTGEEKALPAFLLAFEIGTRDYVAMLATHSFLDVRVAEPNRSADQGFDVSRHVIRSLPIHTSTHGSMGARHRIALAAGTHQAPSPDVPSKSIPASRRN